MLSYFVWFIFVPFDLLAKLAGWLLAIPLGIVAGLTNADRTLPWFQTPDDDVYGSKTRAQRMGDDSGKPDRAFDRVKMAIWWLFRNPAYGFANSVLGVKAGTKRVVSSSSSGIRFEIVDPKGRKWFGVRLSRFHASFGWDWVERDGRHKIEFSINPFKK